MNERRIRIRWNEERKHRILLLLSQGWDYQQMAEEAFGTTRNNVRAAALRLFAEIGADNKCHAITVAFQRGILKIES